MELSPWLSFLKNIYWKFSASIPAYVFGDNLTAKRRSMKDSTLAELVYERMNCHLLDKDQAQGCGMPQQFESVLEWIDESVLDEVFW